MKSNERIIVCLMISRLARKLIMYNLTINMICDWGLYFHIKGFGTCRYGLGHTEFAINRTIGRKSQAYSFTAWFS